MKNFRKIYFPNFSASTFQQICMDVYEVYNKKDKKIKKQIEFKKLSFSGINLITEQKTFEYSKNKFFVGVQFHPEFKSRITTPHPLFVNLIKATL